MFSFYFNGLIPFWPFAPTDFGVGQRRALVPLTWEALCSHNVLVDPDPLTETLAAPGCRILVANRMARRLREDTQCHESSLSM